MGCPPRAAARTRLADLHLGTGRHLEPGPTSLSTRRTRLARFYRISADGGRAQPVTKLDAAPVVRKSATRMPWFLPDGEHLFYAALPGKDGKYDVFVGSIRDDSKVLIGAFDGNARVSETAGWLSPRGRAC